MAKSVGMARYAIRSYINTTNWNIAIGFRYSPAWPAYQHAIRYLRRYAQRRNK